jgi:RNA-directed DNA polymerase
MTWSSVDWTATEAVVGRIQDRIFRAAKAGDGARVKNLQKLLVRSRSAKLLAIRQVTQRNTGRNTPGIDGVVCRTPEDRVTLLRLLHRWCHHRHHQRVGYKAAEA